MNLLALLPMFPDGHPWALYGLGAAFVVLGAWSFLSER